jgi:hypothetical protein
MTVPTEEENIKYEIRKRFRNYIKHFFDNHYNIVTFHARINNIPRQYHHRFCNSLLLNSERPYFTVKMAERVFFEEYEKL